MLQRKLCFQEDGWLSVGLLTARGLVSSSSRWGAAFEVEGRSTCRSLNYSKDQMRKPARVKDGYHLNACLAKRIH